MRVGPLAVVLSLGVGTPTPAGPVSSRVAEETCAATIGVTLRWPEPERQRSPRRAAWICPLIVTGRVVELETDLEAAYHTRVVVRVTATEKGSIPSREIRLMLETGPVGTYAKGQTTDLTSFYEPVFRRGDEVLLFLDTEYEEMNTPGPNPYRLNHGEYRSCLGAYTVRGDKLVSAVPEHPGELPRVTTIEDVRLAVRTQRECRP